MSRLPITYDRPQQLRLKPQPILFRVGNWSDQKKLLRTDPLKIIFSSGGPGLLVSVVGKKFSKIIDFVINKSTLGLVCFGIGDFSSSFPSTKYYIPHTI